MTHTTDHAFSFPVFLFELPVHPDVPYEAVLAARSWKCTTWGWLAAHVPPSLHVALPSSAWSIRLPLPPPPACSGIGVLMNYVLPAYIISVLLVLLMSLLVTQSLGKV